MRIRPLSTLYLRLALKARLKVAAFQRQNQAAYVSRYLRTPERRHQTNSDRRVADSLLVTIHPYALIGHQASAWMSGLLWSRDLGLRLQATELSRDPDRFFSFDPDSGVLNPQKPKKVRLRSVNDERDPTSVELLTAQVARARRRYPDRAIRFELALDQPRWDLTPAAPALREAVLTGSHGDSLRVLEQSPAFVAIHIRRPATAGEISPEQHPDRWLEVGWYERLIVRLRRIPELRDVPVRIVSLGEPIEFQQLSELEGVELNLNGERDLDFVTLAAARLLIFAPSSFSFNAALVSTGAVMGRTPWWHHIPDGGRWAPIAPDGTFDESAVQRALAFAKSSRVRDKL